MGATFQLPNDSLAPGIERGQRFFVTKLGRPYGVGDLILFQFNDAKFVGYLCGVHGDRISIVDGKVIRNGVASACGTGLRREPGGDVPETSMSKEGFVYIVNNGGFDSTKLGPFPADVVKGKISFVFRDAPAGGALESLFALFDF